MILAAYRKRGNVLTNALKKSYDLHVIQRSSPDGTNWGTNLQANAGTSWKTGHQISHSGHAAKVGCRGSLKEMKEGKWQGLGGWWGVNESVGYLKLGDDFFGTSNSVEWISLQLKLLKFTQPLQPRSFLFSTSSDATNLFLGDSSYSGLGQDLLLDCILIRLVICIFIYIYISDLFFDG